MTIPSHYSFTRYLAAKKGIDDRALNKDVWRALASTLPAGLPETPLRVLEIGAGIGTMLERLLEWGLFDAAEYTALDIQPENLAVIPGRLSRWAELHGGSLSNRPDGRLAIACSGRQVLLETAMADLFDFIDRAKEKRSWDLLIAHAFLDLVDLPTVLPLLFQLARPGGWFYFTINFDGVTQFEPQIDPELDDLVQRLYHRTMDERQVGGRASGDSRAGRHLFANLQDAGWQVLAAGASDWVVYPGPGGYPADEAYFLHFIIHTIDLALQACPEIAPELLRRWVSARQAQIERAELVFITHQLDFTGRVGTPPAPGA